VWAEWHDAFAVQLSCAQRCFTRFLLAKSESPLTRTHVARRVKTGSAAAARFRTR
jgi:hypothetical protein